MSWFKRSDRRSPASSERERSDTDPNTCLEVFQNHWKQVCVVLNGQDKRLTTPVGPATVDGVEAVLSNLEQMITLLVGEDDEGGLPGPILQYVLETELLESFCSWCTLNISAHERLRLQQLRLFEHLISQSRQLLLVHRPVIKPLLRLLIDVSESQEMANNGEVEFKLVLVLHQICICISQQSLILESFFSTDADHGPARFLIFSLLIPYIHREGPVGQKARDALLLIMTLSARHPHIGQYIANNSHFCPVLATGLSGLYSSLPRRLTPPFDDWYCITNEDCQRIPDLQMFLNSLEFSNAVVQIAHPLVRDQLIEFIYTGFLVPVLAPALHQISREEVMTATAYLDLFIRHVTDPSLLKAVLKFVMTQRYEDVLILDSLMTRINSNSQLSTVTLALFNTLIDLNCEDVMFQLVFRYLVPCTHVMVSQRRSVRDLDLYGKSAEKFLSLRPACCTAGNTKPVTATDSTKPADNAKPTNNSSPLSHGRPSVPPPPPPSTPGGSLLSELVETGSGESSYIDYLHDARQALAQKARACSKWQHRYDGENPAPDSVALTSNGSRASSQEPRSQEGGTQRKSGEVDGKDGKQQQQQPPTGFIELGSIVNNRGTKETSSVSDGGEESQAQVAFDHPAKTVPNSSVTREADDVFLPAKSDEEGKCNTREQKGVKTPSKEQREGDAKLYESLTSVDNFLSFLSEVKEDANTASDGGDDKVVRRASDAASSLESVLRGLQVAGGGLRSSGSTVRFNSEDQTMGHRNRSDSTSGVDKSVDSAVDVAGLSPITTHTSVAGDTDAVQSEIPVNDLSGLSTSTTEPEMANKTVAWEGLVASEVKVKVHTLHNDVDKGSADSSSFVNISIVPEQGKAALPHDAPQDSGSSTAASTSASPPPPTSSSSTTLPSSSSPPTAKKTPKTPKDFPGGLKSSRILASTPLLTPSSTQAALASQGNGVLPPYRSAVTPADEFPPSFVPSPAPKKQLKYLNDPPNIGPFLSSLLLRLEGMAGNSLYFNLLLTGVISSLAAYPQPLLRSFLLNHNLVFQPSVKSLVQVLSSLRQKLDSYSMTVKQFDQLVDSARHNLTQREMLLYQQWTPSQALDSLSVPGVAKLATLTVDEGSLLNHQQQPQQQNQNLKGQSPSQIIKEKKKVSLSDIFRRSPARDKLPPGKQKRSMSLLQRIQSPGSEGYRHFNPNEEISFGGPGSTAHTGSSGGGVRATQSLSTWNAVYCSVVLDEFVKELSALSLEHSLLLADDGYVSMDLGTEISAR